MSIKKTQKLIDLAKKGGNNADLYILQLIDELENKLEKLDEKMPDLGMFLSNVRGEDGVSIEDISIENGILKITNSEGETFEGYVNGKDAEITEELKEELVSKVKSLIEFPDYSNIFKDLNSKIEKVAKMKNVVEVKETVIEREVIPQEAIKQIETNLEKKIPAQKTTLEIVDEIEKLEGDDRLSFNALKDVPNIVEIKDAITKLYNTRPTGGGMLEVFNSSGNKVGSGSAIQFQGTAVASITHDGHKAIVTLNGGSGGSSVSVNGSEVSNPNLVDNSEIEVNVSGSDIDFSLKPSSIDESKLDSSVNASLDLADSAVQPSDLDDYQIEPIVVSGDTTAVIDGIYHSVATATYTDPSPTEGKGFTVLVRNGTATVGGTAYATAGTIIERIYHSGSWTNYVYYTQTTETNKRTISVILSGTTADDDALTIGDLKSSVAIDSTLNGMNLVAVKAYVTEVSSSGNVLIQIRRSRRSSATARTIVDMLSTGITIEASEFESADATTQPVINTANDDVQTGDMLYFDVDTAGTGVKGPQLLLTFQLP